MIHVAVRASLLALTGLSLSVAPAQAEKPMTVVARLGQPVMKSGEAARNFVRIDVNGCERDRSNRTSVNVAFVIDRSGSMRGARMAQAREAAIAAAKRLTRDDIASVVSFDDKVDVLVPAQPVNDHAPLVARIQQITERGSTAIHAGVTVGADEVRKFKDNRRLNRVVLLSDGIANIGPSRPEDFAVLGGALLAEGISVSTIGLGLGYNEDLMQKLARASDGNHAFAGDAADLIQIFNREFDDVLASCAQTVSVDIEFRPGVRPVRSLSRDGAIAGQTMQFRFNQIYQNTTHYVLLEVEVDRNLATGEQDLGHVRVAYASPQDGVRQTLETDLRGRFSTSQTEVNASRDGAVLEAALEQVTRERTQAAIKLRDQGKTAEARALFQKSNWEIEAYLAVAASPSPHLKALKSELGEITNTQTASPAQWNEQRKRLRHLDAAPAGAGVRY